MPNSRPLYSQAPRHISIAVEGNPNSGKTTLFNALTGSNAKIGNYPGITVDRRTAIAKLPNHESVELVDVPGTYSLTARSGDEEIAINELLGRKGLDPADAALVVIDSTSLERGLFLLMQILEFEIPTVAALNMTDLAEKLGISIDVNALSKVFGIPFIPVSARRRIGLNELTEAIDDLLSGLDHYTTPTPIWKPPQELEANLQEMEPVIQEEVHFPLPTERSRKAFASWLLMSLSPDSSIVVRPRLKRLTEEIQERISNTNRDLDKEIIVNRYRFIDENASLFIKRTDSEKPHNTDRIDAVLTHPFLGLFVFIFIMGVIFEALFSWSDPLIGLIEDVFTWLAGWVQATLPPSVATDLLTEGVISGVGGVLVFLPQILFLFLFITILEGTGYLSRAAFMIDRLMRKIGLNGHAFVPMLSGFACAVPAIMATRTIEDRRDRMVTLMAVPLMSCSARLPVYTLIIALLFPADHMIGPVSIGTFILLAIYLLSTVFALIAAAILGKTVFKGNPKPLLLELPPYRWPDFKTVMMVMWERARVFLSTAGTIILVMTILLWFLLSFPKNTELSRDYDTLREKAGNDKTAVAQLVAAENKERLRNSYAGKLGTALEPLIAPLGFDWKIGIGLIGAFAAREVFVGTMGVVYGIGDTEANDEHLRNKMQKDKRPNGQPLWTPLVGMSLMVFFMLAMQCFSTLAVTRSETKSWGWTLFMLAYMTGLAYGASFLVYQTGRLLGFT